MTPRLYRSPLDVLRGPFPITYADIGQEYADSADLGPAPEAGSLLLAMWAVADEDDPFTATYDGAPVEDELIAAVALASGQLSSVVINFSRLAPTHVPNVMDGSPLRLILGDPLFTLTAGSGEVFCAVLRR